MNTYEDKTTETKATETPKSELPWIKRDQQISDMVGEYRDELWESELYEQAMSEGWGLALMSVCLDMARIQAQAIAGCKGFGYATTLGVADKYDSFNKRAFVIKNKAKRLFANAKTNAFIQVKLFDEEIEVIKEYGSV